MYITITKLTFGAIPDPDHNRWVSWPGGNKTITILCHLGPIDARDQIIVAKDTLR